MSVGTGTFSTLCGSGTKTERLTALKDLKNSVIGNTWKKVEVAEDEEVLALLLQWLQLPLHSNLDNVSLEIIVEIAVIIGALANVGTLTLRPLLLSQAPSRLLQLICGTRSSPLAAADKVRLLSALLRALRNVLVATADLVWGYMWGVGLKRKVVSTGLGDGVDLPPEERARGSGSKGKNVDKGFSSYDAAVEALNLVFEDENLSVLLSFLVDTTNLQILLPLYQLLARLIALPKHRQALISWCQEPPDSRLISITESRFRSSGPVALTPPTLGSASSRPPPDIILHLLDIISPPCDNGIGTANLSRRNPKLLEAAVDLLAALVKGQPDIARTVRHWQANPSSSQNSGMDVDEDRPQDFMDDLMALTAGSTTAVRIAATSCLTNLLRSEKTSAGSEGSIRRGVLNRQLLDTIAQLLEGENTDDRVKLCFILAAMVSDDAGLQKAAAERGCPTRLLDMFIKLDAEEARGELGGDAASRAREAILLALASLAFQTESTRSLVAEHQPPFLPHILASLSHASYGVRAAACQLTRALSRTIAILKTSLIDSGIADEIVVLLRRETKASKPTESDGQVTSDEASSEERGWIVEVAATGALCNLVVDFSPLRAKLIADGGLALLISLTKSPHTPLAVNALWAIKNLTFRAVEGTKAAVMAEMGYDHLKLLMSPMIPPSLRAQALCIAQNLVADETQLELNRTVEAFGEEDLLNLIQSAASDQDSDVRTPALYILSNLALGNERTRQALVSRVGLLEALSDSLNAKSETVQFASLRTMRHLIETSTRSRRPRQAMIEVFQPFQLRSRLVDIADQTPSFDVRHAALALAEVLEKARGEGGVSGTR